MRQPVGILGIPVDRLNTAATLQRLDEFIQSRRFHQVATANVDFLINAIHDPDLRKILCSADLVTPDGMPVVWASRFFGAPLPERVTGADLVPKLASLAAEKQYRIYMLGARPEVAQCARQRMEQHYPGIRIVGCVSPPPCPLADLASNDILKDIERAGPDILLVAFGNPKQEKWIHMHRERLQNVGICMGVGGTFDFLAGQTSRAPMWMQRHGLEWLHRLAHEPRRLWRRYARDIVYFTLFLAHQFWLQCVGRWGSLLRHRKQERSSVDLTLHVDYSIVHVQGALLEPQLPGFIRLTTEALTSSPHLILDVTPDVCVGAAALGALLDLVRQTSSQGGELRIVGAMGNFRKLLQMTRVSEYVSLYDTLAEALYPNPLAAREISMRMETDHSLCLLSSATKLE